ncbi:MerR family transcriptional regulator [Desmospora profundinema]|uniref:MerR family glutamine synthetase transcriptional repressor n=1 Tax=Desmospora profundinema TaxID=1571184 RepID=A0ABU1IIB8_9BACL|nr:MerR family transcriptional regulator [Desmospora profundinema]MDR6224287.1 MerR family glutamine synthetase transcriptional repressor [Desmospora profundinema]
MRDEIRRNMPLFSIGIVTKLTELTPRQVRYYEQQELIKPSRTSGNQRLFSFNDVDRLLHIKSLMEKGINIAGVKEMLSGKKAESEAQAAATAPAQKPDMSDAELRKLLKRQLTELTARPNQNHLIRGELSRFFH